MPTQAVYRKLKRFRRQFGVAAPRVVVRNQYPLRWYLFAVTMSLALLLSSVWLLFERNTVLSLGDELLLLRGRTAVQDEELARLRSVTGTEQNQIRMEYSTKRSLIARLQELERENVLLKEDIRLFERLIPVQAEAGLVRVESLRLSFEADGRYRYRLMLAFQPDKQTQEFRGRLQITAKFHQDGKEKQIRLPLGRESDGSFEVRHFLRREGFFSLPAGGRFESVEVKVFQGDILKAERVAQLKE